MRGLCSASVIVACLVLFGCATAYQPVGLKGGYSETLLTPDTYRISFRGNAYTSAERAQDFALLRACELVLERGYTHFAIIDEQNEVTSASFTTSGRAHTTSYGTGTSSGTLYANPYGGTYSGTSTLRMDSNTTYTPPQTYTFYRPRTGLLVHAFPTKPEDIFAFDAAFLMQSLKQKYRIK
jgi:hypothetical protein